MPLLSMLESFELLQRFKIPHTRPILLSDDKIRVLSYPCIIKADVEGVIHKSDAGLIVLHIKDERELKEAYHKMVFHTRSIGRLKGIYAFSEISGIEIFIGMKQDPQFGPVVSFGLGGIFVEILMDVSFRIAPFSKKEALMMIDEIRGVKILEGARGNEPVDKRVIADVLVGVGELGLLRKDVLELDLNPVFAKKNACIVADARVVI